MSSSLTAAFGRTETGAATPTTAPVVDVIVAVPDVLTLARSVTAVVRLWTNTSSVLLVSAVTRFDASDVNATRLPSSLMLGWMLRLFAWVPAVATLTRTVAPACRSRRKMSGCPFVSPGTRLVALETNAT